MLRKRLERDRKLAKIERWPSNGRRHSFASYHTAEFKDAGMLALELGHRDQKLIFAHYRELVRPADAGVPWHLNVEPSHRAPHCNLSPFHSPHRLCDLRVLVV